MWKTCIFRVRGGCVDELKWTISATVGVFVCDENVALEALAYMVVVVAREAGADVWLGDGLWRRNAFHKQT